jgi:hypothetical protein
MAVKEHKWAKFKSKLPEFREEPAYEEKIDRAKREILGIAPDQDPEMEVKNYSLPNLGRRLAQFRLEKEKIEQLLYDINVKIAAMDRLIPMLMLEEGSTAFKITGGVGFSLKEDVFPKLENEQAFADSLPEDELEALRAIQPQRFKSHIKDLLENGRPLPPGTSASYKTSVAVRDLKNFQP